jgi:hypothetical protein
MPRFVPDADDLTLITDRLQLGLPLRGFDGRDIPLYDTDGAELDPIDAAHALLMSGASLLPPDESDAFIDLAIARAQGVEAASFAAGDSPALVAAKVTAVLVSAAVRATVIARGRDISPSALNRATLSWYEMQELRRRELIEASLAAEGRSLSA